MSVRASRLMIAAVLAFAAAGAPWSAAPASAASAGAPTLGLGHEYDLGGARDEFLLPDPLADPSIATDHPLYLRLRVPWALLEPVAGEYDWFEVERVIEPYRAARYVVILSIYGPNPAVDPAGVVPSPRRPDVLKAWLDLMRAAALRFKGRVAYYEVWDAPNRDSGWPVEAIDEFGYVLKNTSVTIRSADADAMIVQGLAVGEATVSQDLAWQESLYGQGAATYVDVLRVRPEGDAPLAAVLAAAYDLLLAHDPSAQMWTGSLRPRGDTDAEKASDLIARFMVGHGEGAAVVSFDLEAGRDGLPELPAVLLDLHKLFIPTYSRVPGSSLRFEPLDGEEAPPGGALKYHFFDSDAFQGLIGFAAPDPASEGRARLVIDTAAVRGIALYDIVGGAAGPVDGAVADFKTNTTRVPVVIRQRPQIVQYSRVPIKGFEAEKEQVEVAGTGLVTAEEVIAGHQAFMADQKYRLRHYSATATLTYHGKVAGSDTIDITIENAFFWDPGTGAEWEQRALYYNGVRWKGKKLPELPIPQPEKVFALPLDINLNKDYAYTYVGTDECGEFRCHVLDFKPIDPSLNLYEGRAWIETRTFAPVKTNTVQSRLAAPLISSEETDFYAPRTGPDGTTFWLLSRIEGQQILTVAGQNLVLLREIDFTELRINDPGFEAARRSAYDSDRRMLRDTDKGLRYLERTPEGERVVKEGVRKSALLGLAGLYRQSGLDYPVVPLLGAGYFNFELRGREIQMTALLGGVVNLFSLSDPRAFDTKVDTSVQVVTLAVNVTDQLFILGKERSPSNVDVRSQSLALGAGVPLGSFMRARATYGLEYENYGRDEDTRSFVVPSDTFVHLPGVAWEFNRAGWTIAAGGESGRRSRWSRWGDTTAPASDPDIIAGFPGASCNSPGSCFADEPRSSFKRYEIGVAKQFFLPRFQKIRVETIWQSGSDLDRFSEYRIAFFGNRVRGFAGSGLRYDRGVIARAQYAFNVADVVRFDATVDHAYVRDSLTADEYGRFTGFGVAGNLMGPWETILQFDVGVAVQSEFRDLRGKTEFQLGLLKYF